MTSILLSPLFMDNLSSVPGDLSQRRDAERMEREVAEKRRTLGDGHIHL